MGFSPETYAVLKAQGGGGGGLPAVTSDDVGKGLSVQTVYTKGAVIVPEQTVTIIDGNASVVGANASLFVNGTICVVDVNDEEGVLTIDDNGEIFSVDDAGFYLDDGEINVGADYVDNTKLTVALYVANISYQWAADPYAGYDLVIKLNVGLELGAATTATVVKGNFSELQAKATTPLPVTCMVWGADEGDPDHMYTRVFDVQSIVYDTYFEDPADYQFYITVTNIYRMNNFYAATMSGGATNNLYRNFAGLGIDNRENLIRHISFTASGAVFND